MVAKHYIPGAVPPDLDDTADYPPLPESALAAAQSPPPGQTTVVAQPADTWIMPKLAGEPAPSVAAPAPAATVPEELLHALSEENAQLRTELAKGQGVHDELRRRLETANAERDELRRRLDTRNGNVRELERRVQQEAERTVQTQRNAALLEDRSAAAAAELEARGAELEARGAELRAAEERLRETEARLRAAEDQLRGAEDQLRDSAVRRRDADDQRQVAEDRIRSSEDRAHAAEDQLRAAEEQRRAADAERSELRARLESAQAELALLTQQRERLAASQSEIDRDRTRRDAVLARNQDELTELQRRLAGHGEALRAVEGQRQVYDSQLREREAMLDEAQARLREATAARERSAAETAAALARAADAERRLAQRPEPAPVPPVPVVPAPDPGLAGRIAALEAELAEQCALVSSLREQLHGAHDTQQALRAELAEQAHHVPPVVAAPAPLPERERLLVRTSGESGIVHVLGRRTTIGRTPDNDVRVEADYASRHHAVVLAGPERTIVEDLNSTNGVFVNGVRVTRHELCEGDLLAIGETSFRYVLKPPGEQP
jgi:hypothetical protein